MPCGHHRGSRRSAASQVSARCTARPGASVRRARRSRSPQQGGAARPGRRASAASASISATVVRAVGAGQVRARRAGSGRGSVALAWPHRRAGRGAPRRFASVVAMRPVVDAAIAARRSGAGRAADGAGRGRGPLGVPRRQGRARGDRRPRRWSARSPRSSAAGSRSTGWLRRRAADRRRPTCCASPWPGSSTASRRPDRARPGALARARRARRRRLAGAGPAVPRPSCGACWRPGRGPPARAGSSSTRTTPGAVASPGCAPDGFEATRRARAAGRRGRRRGPPLGGGHRRPRARCSSCSSTSTTAGSTSSEEPAADARLRPLPPLDLPTAPQADQAPRPRLGPMTAPTSACCSSTPTPTTSRSAPARRWRSTSPRAAASPW